MPGAIWFPMTLSDLPLSYCTNVHPGTTAAQVEDGLDRYTVPIRERIGGPLAAGLWLADPVARELLDTRGRLDRFAADLGRRGLTCHTLNAFPYGDFHSPRVKENVYRPDWADPERLAYTRRCARILAALLPEGVEGSISTVPLGFKGFDHPPGFIDRCADQLIQVAEDLDWLLQETGRLIRLAIEPEPLCLIETTGEAIGFFDRLGRRAEQRDAAERVRRHIGLCYDICHQAVEFEDPAESIRAIHGAGIRINKVHISCALRLSDTAGNESARRALARYAEPRYLHQTIGRTANGDLLRRADLSEELAMRPDREMLSAAEWRVHFHVPVDADRLGPLSTTRPALRPALAAVAGLPYAPHLEVETYTWEVLPGEHPPDLVEGLTRELAATRELLAQLIMEPAD